jgi:hypothetical protein
MQCLETWHSPTHVGNGGSSGSHWKALDEWQLSVITGRSGTCIGAGLFRCPIVRVDVHMVVIIVFSVSVSVKLLRKFTAI